MVGSAGTFIFFYSLLGIIEQTAAKIYPRKNHRGQKKEEKWVRFEPFNGYKLTFTINFLTLFLPLRSKI